ncbi:MAG: polyphosphate kinase 1, partial [Treponema sp.]|nr:polyphosphate kinase 1 [Treponema sp.]
MEKALYFNRDLSWIDFNRRVLEEGLRRDLPPLERLSFLSIVSTNFDEFFMVRVAAMKRLAHSRGDGAADPSLLSPAEQLREVSRRTRSVMERQYHCLVHEVFPDLARGGLELVRPDSYTLSQMDYLESFFLGRIYPILTPLRVEDEGLPFIDSLSLNAAFLLVAVDREETGAANVGGKGDAGGPSDEHIAVVRIPPALDRIVYLPRDVSETKAGGNDGGPARWALLEDLVVTWGGYLFPGHRVTESMVFKVNRDADFSVDEKRDEDFIEAMEEVIEGRERSPAIRMVFSPGSGKLRDELARRLSLEADDLYEADGPFNLGYLPEFMNIKGFEKFREKSRPVYPSAAFHEEEPFWDTIRRGDVMIHLPYESFDPVIRFFREAASDPQVISIKTALYRTGGSGGGAVSPVVRALEQAALNGKHVTAVVELKARFDEEQNISWAKSLEKAGVIVVYGLARLKVHAKISMVIRRENDRVRRYVHVSTGNYNDRTSRIYEDISIFTCREEIAFDAGLLFNMITGYSVLETMRKLVIAPVNLKRRLLELVERETKRTGQGYSGRIMAKLNALSDTDIVNALYRASQAGVQVLLCIRGICTLVPGVPGLSENIQVTGIIDRYLEHSRIYYFSNGGAEELYIASADWMPRNLERRVELMYPVEDEKIRAELVEVLNGYFRDNCQSFRLDSAGDWTRSVPAEGEKPFRIQEELLARTARRSEVSWPVKQEFIVRRS